MFDLACAHPEGEKEKEINMKLNTEKLFCAKTLLHVSF